MRLTVLALLMALAAPLRAATPFRTPLLQKMARVAGIAVGDSLSPGTEQDSVAIVRGKPVYLRVNAQGQVSHIGYRLFAKAMTDFYGKAAVFDFVERYLLELDLGLDDRGAAKRMHVDGVTLVKGSLAQLRSITPETETTLNVEEIKRRMFRLTWLLEGQEVCLVIPADGQLLLGANTIELEQMARQDIPRMAALTRDELITDWSGNAVTRSGSALILAGGTYMSSAIRGDVYLTDSTGTRQIICSPERPTRSVANILLTGIAENLLPTRLVLNEYGNRADTLQVALQQFIAYCKAEGCKLYFGIKSMNAETLQGTLFAHNEDLAYTHMLAVDFPLCLLRNEAAEIQATAYLYIPMQHIAEAYFNQDFNPNLYEQE